MIQTAFGVLTGCLSHVLSLSEINDINT